MAARRAAKDLVPLLALAHVAGAGVDADDQIGRGVAQALEGVGGVVGAMVVPAVLAHQQAHLRAANAQHLGHVWPGLEVAALVEDVVGGQQLLGVLQAHGAALQHQQAVVQALARACGGRGRAHHPVQRGQLGRCLLQRRQAVLHQLQEGRLVQHVTGVVAAQREFAEHDEVGLLAGGLLPATPIELLHVGDASEAARLHLDQAAAKLAGAGFASSARIEAGAPNVVIPQRVVLDDIDMLAVTAFGSSRLKSMLLGSLTSELLRACQVPVLLC